MFVAVDLFSGGGGLTQGLVDAGFCVSAAIENELEAIKTYEANHRDTVVFNHDIRGVSGVEIIKTSPTGKIDLVAGCPPCQGFSALTQKYKRDDPRNELVFEFYRLVREIRPSIFMMENVPGLSSKGSPYFGEVVRKLKRLGYQTTYDVLEVADYGVPQRRKRLVFLGSLKGPLEIPRPTHFEHPTGRQKKWRTVKNAIGRMSRSTPIELQKIPCGKTPSAYNWHVIRTLSPINIERLKATRAGTSRASLPVELRPKCHQHSDRGFSNVYGRMAWDQPSPTITGGCTTLSKGRFGHPTELRTISVREAAALQTFPTNYRFDTTYIDHVSQIIGNALPPLFAATLAKNCMKHLLSYK